MKYRMIWLVFVMFLITAGCAKKKKELVTVSGPRSDLSSYECFPGNDHVFYDTNVKEMIANMDEGKTFAVCFGFSECSWCREAMPLINDAAKQAGFEVGYIDTRKNPAWESNMDIDDYDLLVARLGEYIEFDQEGLRHLYTPSLFVIRNGQAVGYHEGTVETHNANVRQMSQEEKAILSEIYREMFDTMKNGKDAKTKQ
ncbi:MAG: hypothetical protein IKE16_03610 [Solobacterium sp.]|nr:hypothetical protein [Solobacterium sp.]